MFADSEFFPSAMDPARFYGTRVPPVDDSEDSCLSDSDSEYSPDLEPSAPTEESGSDPGAEFHHFCMAHSQAIVRCMQRGAVSSCLRCAACGRSCKGTPPAFLRVVLRRRDCKFFFFFSGGLHGPLVDRNTIRAFAFHIAAALFHSVAPLANCAGLSFYINPPLPFVDLLFSIEDYK